MTVMQEIDKAACCSRYSQVWEPGAATILVPTVAIQLYLVLGSISWPHDLQ